MTEEEPPRASKAALFLPPRFVDIEGLVYYTCASLGRLAELIRFEQKRLPERPPWMLQAFLNHYHFSESEGEETCLRTQFTDADCMKQELQARFPFERFVFLLDPLATSSFYQVADGAPIEDEEWEPNGPLSGVVLQNKIKAGLDPTQARAETFEASRLGTCGNCKKSWRYETDYLRPEFPGTRWSDCPSCSVAKVVAVKTLRRLL